MKFFVTVHQDEDGMFVAECPTISRRVSQGKTEEEAYRNIQEAIRERLKCAPSAGCP